MAQWPDNKCGRCGFKTSGALDKVTCPKCGKECCVACGPHDRLPEDKRWCKSCLYDAIHRAVADAQA
jgi:hypothetical protein